MCSREATVIPAHPLALTAERRLDERRQRALTRYYVAAGAGGVAVGVHTTQFAIRDPRVGLFDPVLQLAAEEMDRADRGRTEPLVRVGGVCGDTAQATREAARLSDLGFHAGLLSLSALHGRVGRGAHRALPRGRRRSCRSWVSILQPAVGGRILSYGFWRRFAEIENVVAIKIAPFNRYQTLDVIRAVADSGRDVPLYTGNDDNIVMDLSRPSAFGGDGAGRTSGLSAGSSGTGRSGRAGRSSCWQECRARRHAGVRRPAPFDPTRRRSHRRECRVLRCREPVRRMHRGPPRSAQASGVCSKGRGVWIPHETLSAGQMDEIDRVYRAYPHLNDDEFVREGRDAWLRP